MSRKVKSIKGDVVDFDLFQVKEQMSKSPKTSDVLMRERYIDVKRRRASRKDINQLLAEQNKNKVKAQKSIEKSKTESAKNAENEKVDDKVDDKLKAQDSVEEVEVKDEVTETVETTPKTKRRVVKKK